MNQQTSVDFQGADSYSLGQVSATSALHRGVKAKERLPSQLNPEGTWQDVEVPGYGHKHSPSMSPGLGSELKMTPPVSGPLGLSSRSAPSLSQRGLTVPSLGHRQRSS